MTGLTEFVRNVAVVGHLHHGKTALMDMLVFETHKVDWDSDHQVRASQKYPTTKQTSASRPGIRTLMFCQESEGFPSNPRPCPWFYKIATESRISSISLTRPDT